jgi:hypothetical protein
MELGKKSWLLVGASSLLSFALGWGFKPKETEVVEVQPTKSARSEVVTRSKSLNRPDVSGWMRRLENEEAENWSDQLADEDFEPLLEEMMAGMWGQLTRDDLENLQELVGRWASRDMEDCLAWARELKNERHREVGLVMVAKALSESNPERAFDVLCEIEEASLSRLWSSIHVGLPTEVVKGPFQKAFEAGPEELLRTLSRLPEGAEDASLGGVNFNLEYPQDFEFGPFLTQYFYGDPENSLKGKGYFGVANPYREWVQRDLPEAFEWSLSLLQEREEMRRDSSLSNWEHMFFRMDASRQNDAENWLAHKLASLSPKELDAMERGADIFGDTQYFGTLVDRMGPNEMRKFFDNIGEGVQTNPFKFHPELLEKLPNVNERVEILEQLRGVYGEERIGKILLKWGVNEARAAEVMEKVN